MNQVDLAVIISLFTNSILISTILFGWLGIHLRGRTNDSKTAKSIDNSNHPDFSHLDESPPFRPTSMHDVARDKAGAKREVFDDAYVRIYQRYNKDRQIWEDFTPNAREMEGAPHEGVIFIVYYRYNEPTDVREFETLIEVKSKTLTQVLRRCTKIVDSKMAHTTPGVNNFYYGDTSGGLDRAQVPHPSLRLLIFD